MFVINTISNSVQQKNELTNCGIFTEWNKRNDLQLYAMIWKNLTNIKLNKEVEQKSTYFMIMYIEYKDRQN